MFTKVKKHFKDHKEAYIVGGIGVVACVGVLVFTRSTNAGAETIQVTNQIGLRNESTQVLITLPERSTPSKPVHLVGTDLYYPSLNEASRKTGHSLSMLSKHVNGHIPDLNGDVFELLQPA